MTLWSLFQPMQTLVFKKQLHPADVPAFSNRDVYEFINGKKPPGKVHKAGLKLKRMFSFKESRAGSKNWIFSGLLAGFLIIVSLVLMDDGYREKLLPIQFGVASFITLVIHSKVSRETQFFNVSGVLAILLAVLIPVLVLNMYSSWSTAALFLPAHLAICGIAAVFRSDEYLELKLIFYKALSYFVFTVFMGWLSHYALTNL